MSAARVRSGAVWARLAIGLALAACRADSNAREDAAGEPDAAMLDAAIDASAVDAPAIDAATDAVIDAAVDAAIDARPVPDVMYRPPQPLPPGTCAPPLGDWSGTTGYEFGGCAACSDGHAATITWQLASTDGCIDRYVPSGMVTKYDSGVCRFLGNNTTTIAPTDGALVIDRSTIPPTYEMTGETHWTAQRHDDCNGVETTTPVQVGVIWAAFRGEIAGDVFGGGNRPSSDDMDWRFTRMGAQPVTPAPCVEPPVDVWVGRSSSRGLMSAEVTWVRVSTTGCSDVFEPAGVARQLAGPNWQCTHVAATPDHAPIAAGDGTLRVDRSRWPPSFFMTGRTVWAAQVTCTRPDGTVVTLPQAGGDWAYRIVAPYTGDRAAGEITSASAFGSTPESWALAKVP